MEHLIDINFLSRFLYLVHMRLETEILSDLKEQGADFVYFIDISTLSNMLSRLYPRAIIFGISLSPVYLFSMTRNDEIDGDEFSETERKSDLLADLLAVKLQEKGFTALSQSEKNLVARGFYDECTQSTIMPHKTIAGLAGMGWIGKHNLLVSPEFGSAISLCSVLTDAPLLTRNHAPASPECGDCSICRDACIPHAIKGNTWEKENSRDALVDIRRCTGCLKCLVLCPWTQNYMNHYLEN